MQRSIVIFGACLAALGLSNALTVAGASAGELPEFSKVGEAFTSAQGSSFIEFHKEQVVCKVGAGAGLVASTTRVKLTLRYKECEYKASKCTSPEASSGEIVTSPLVGDLGYLKIEPTEAGLDLSPEVAEDAWSEFTCGTTSIVVGPAGGGDTVIGKISPVNVATIKFVVEFKCVGGGKQEHSKLLNKKGMEEKVGELEALVGGVGVQACLNTTAALEFAKSEKISA